MCSYLKNILKYVILVCFLGLIAADDAVSPTKPRQCYSCEGINCQRITKQNVTTTCSDLLDICVTIFEGSTVVSKGCYLDIPDQLREKCEDNNNAECLKCFGQLCNNKGRKDFKCIECFDNAKCATDTTAMEPVQCSIPTASNSYCYIRSFRDKRVQRGCYVHTPDQVKCTQDENCSMCLSVDGIACNSYKVLTTSAQSRAKQHFSVLLITIISLCGFLR